VRLPRREVAAELLRNEQRWLPLLAPRLPLPIPLVSRVGVSTDDYPWQWSVVPWLPGSTADLSDVGADQAQVLATFLDALHIAAPAEAPRNPVRGVPLATRSAVMSERLQRLRRLNRIEPPILEIWNRALATSIDVADTWMHGDLHARNVLVVEGKFTAVIDWGDVGQGDRATDLASIWTLLPSRDARATVMQMLADVTDATWTRARGWAVLFGVTLLDTGLIDNPRHARIGKQILQRVVDGP